MNIGIILAPYYKHIIDGLYEGATRYLAGKDIDFQYFEVAGALEIPLACQMLAETEQFDGLIALGAVIRGETAHFDYVCQESAKGIMDVSLKHNIPIGNGILTVENENQALARSCEDESMGKHNKGNEAAHAVVSLLELKKTLKR